MAKNASEQNHYYLAEWLREIRIKCGFSQKAVAKALNVNRSTYTYYENGKTTPDPMTLHRIAAIFGVPIETFFAEEPPVPIAGDPDGKKQRSPKKVLPDPQRVGQLSPAEKEVIAFLRDRGVSPELILESLKRRFDDEDSGSR